MGLPERDCWQRSSGASRAPGARPAHGPDAFTASVFASASSLTHQTAKGSEPIAGPDDITALAGRITSASRTASGRRAETSPTGNAGQQRSSRSTRPGKAVAQWDVVGKCDGLYGGSADDRLIATVNEDGNSSLYLIDPGRRIRPSVRDSYNEPLPSQRRAPTRSAIYHGAILISASAPGTIGSAAPQAAYPAVYRARLNASTHVATVHGDLLRRGRRRRPRTPAGQEGHDGGARARSTPTRTRSCLAGARFAGDFMVTSQADKEQIYVSDAGAASQKPRCSSAVAIRRRHGAGDWPRGRPLHRRQRQRHDLPHPRPVRAG